MALELFKAVHLRQKGLGDVRHGDHEFRAPKPAQGRKEGEGPGGVGTSSREEWVGIPLSHRVLLKPAPTFANRLGQSRAFEGRC